MIKIQATRISLEQYRALQRPVVKLPRYYELFDQIVETLVAKGLMKYDFADHFRNIIPKIPKNRLFLLIPPRPAELDLDYLMSLIEVNGQKGINCNGLEAKYLTDTVKVPEGAYLVLDIEDGKERLNTKPLVSEANILAEHRSPLTLFEGIIHGIVFPEVFNDHNMDLCGSRHENKYTIPHLSLFEGILGLSTYWEETGGPIWGVPSCGRRKPLKH